MNFGNPDETTWQQWPTIEVSLVEAHELHLRAQRLSRAGHLMTKHNEKYVLWRMALYCRASGSELECIRRWVMDGTGEEPD